MFFSFKNHIKLFLIISITLFRYLSSLRVLSKPFFIVIFKYESKPLKNDKDEIALIGVENWGAGGFKKNGDFDKASANLNESMFKILLSHDPSHWQQKIIEHPVHVDLTLSGHTHGMQFGIEIPGWIKWSPAKYRYKYWAGIYKEKNQFINVNRGFGFLAYPGRVGIYPEISLLELHSQKSV